MLHKFILLDSRQLSRFKTCLDMAIYILRCTHKLQFSLTFGMHELAHLFLMCTAADVYLKMQKSKSFRLSKQDLSSRFASAILQPTLKAPRNFRQTTYLMLRHETVIVTFPYLRRSVYLIDFKNTKKYCIPTQAQPV